MKLDPKRTFRSIIIGSSNKRAVERTRLMVSARRDRPSVLLILGHSGAGKTHLLQASANELLRRRPSALLQLVTADAFMNRYVWSIRNGRVDAIRRVIEACDGLFVDEMEDLVGLLSTQQELLRAIAFFVANGKPVVLATAPTKGQEVERLICELPNAAMVGIGLPTIRQRVTALRRTARKRRASVTRVALENLARSGRTISETRAALERVLFVRQATSCHGA